MEVWKCLGDVAVEFLTGTFNKIFESEMISEEWRKIVCWCHFFKNKGDRVIRLMSHTMKL